jgi:hypothetical protein
MRTSVQFGYVISNTSATTTLSADENTLLATQLQRRLPNSDGSLGTTTEGELFTEAIRMLVSCERSSQPYRFANSRQFYVPYPVVAEAGSIEHRLSNDAAFRTGRIEPYKTWDNSGNRELMKNGRTDWRTLIPVVLTDAMRERLERQPAPPLRPVIRVLKCPLYTAPIRVEPAPS